MGDFRTANVRGGKAESKLRRDLRTGKEIYGTYAYYALKEFGQRVS